MSAQAAQTILLVEDNESLRRMLAKMLDSFGYEVLQAADGLQAVDTLEANSERIDLVIS